MSDVQAEKDLRLAMGERVPGHYLRDEQHQIEILIARIRELEQERDVINDCNTKLVERCRRFEQERDAWRDQSSREAKSRDAARDLLRRISFYLTELMDKIDAEDADIATADHRDFRDIYGDLGPLSDAARKLLEQDNE